jgi:hypothetical protein
MNSLNNQKNYRYRPGNIKISSDLTNLTTAILILTVQMFFEWTYIINMNFTNVQGEIEMHRNI